MILGVINHKDLLIERIGCCFVYFCKKIYLNMKKYLLTLTLILASFGFANAQVSKVGNAELTKISRPAVIGEYGIAADIVEGAIKKKFSDMKLGSGDKTKDGYRVFKGVEIADIAPGKMDLYYRVEDRKPNSTVYLIMSKGYDNFMKTDEDSAAYANAMQFLEKFVVDATAFQLNKDIEKQEEVIADVEKDLKKLNKNEESLNKDKSKAESKISSATIEQSSLKNEMEAQQKLLEQVKTKTATIDQMDALKKEVSKQESAVSKATKNYEKAVKKVEDTKSDLNKAESKIGDNKIEIDKVKNQLQNENQKLQDLKDQLANLK